MAFEPRMRPAPTPDELNARSVQPSPEMIQRIAAAFQNQRNQALDALAVTEAKVNDLIATLSKANETIKELQSKIQPDKKEEPTNGNL